MAINQSARRISENIEYALVGHNHIEDNTSSDTAAAAAAVAVVADAVLELAEKQDLLHMEAVVLELEDLGY